MIDSNILLQGRVPTTSNPFLVAQQSANAVNNINNLPLLNALNQQKLETGQSNLDTAALNRQLVQSNINNTNEKNRVAAEDKAQLEQINALKNASKVARPFVESGDLLGALNAIGKVEGLTNTDLQDITQEFATGNFDSILKQMDAIDSLDTGKGKTDFIKSSQRFEKIGNDTFSVIDKINSNGSVTPVRTEIGGDLVIGSGTDIGLTAKGSDTSTVDTAGNKVKREGEEKAKTPLGKQELLKRKRIEAEAKKETEDAIKKEKLKANAKIEKINNLMPQIDSIIKNADWTTTGVAGKILSLVPNTDAFDQASIIQTIKANIGFDTLQEMRDNSPTGGALGQVAIQELDALQNSIASLNNGQSLPQFRHNLMIIRQHYQNWKEIVDNGRPKEKDPTVIEKTGGNTSTKIPDDLLEFMTEEERSKF